VTRRLYIGNAGWAVPTKSAERCPGAGTHLQRYAQVFRGAEINTTFYRPHAGATFSRWARSTGGSFRFAVKMPRLILLPGASQAKMHQATVECGQEFPRDSPRTRQASETRVVVSRTGAGSPPAFTGCEACDEHRWDADAQSLNGRRDWDPTKEGRSPETNRRSSRRARLLESDVLPLGCDDAPSFLIPSSAPRSSRSFATVFQGSPRPFCARTHRLAGGTTRTGTVDDDNTR
jgi:hypothetical protein